MSISSNFTSLNVTELEHFLNQGEETILSSQSLHLSPPPPPGGMPVDFSSTFKQLGQGFQPITLITGGKLFSKVQNILKDALSFISSKGKSMGERFTITKRSLLENNLVFENIQRNIWAYPLDSLEVEPCYLPTFADFESTPSAVSEFIQENFGQAQAAAATQGQFARNLEGLIKCAANQGNAEVLKYILESIGADAAEYQDFVQLILKTLVLNSDLAALRNLETSGISITKPDNFIDEALKAPGTEMLSYLIEQGLNLVEYLETKIANSNRADILKMALEEG